MTDRTMTLDGGKLPMQMDRVNEILNSAEMGISELFCAKATVQDCKAPQNYANC